MCLLKGEKFKLKILVQNIECFWNVIENEVFLDIGLVCRRTIALSS